MSGAARWLAAACALAACGDALADLDVTWPGCSKPELQTTLEVIQPGQTNTNVTGIHLKGCNITTVNLKSLQVYPHLKFIYLNSINVTNITASTFDSFTDLEALYMINSSIIGKKLPFNLFRNCGRLYYIKFDTNDLSDAPADLLQGLDQLQVLLLYNCTLLEVPSFFSSQIFPNLKHFSAMFNEMSEISLSTFANAVNLTDLDLTANHIVKLRADLTNPLTKLKSIFLTLNRLQDIPEAFFQNMPSLEFIQLSRNQIENIPLNAFLGTNLKSLYLNDNRLTHLPPNFILNLQATGISLKKFYFHNNPWECACLNNLVIRAKQLDITYKSRYLNDQSQTCRLGEMILQDSHC